MIIEKNKSLLKYNTFGIDAICDEFILIEQDDDLININFDADKLILGGGSNILISKTIPQVIHLNTKGIETIEENEEFIIIKVKSGEIWDDFVKYCVEKNYGGIENLSNIPGSVGASPIQNIGAYGVDVSETIEKVKFYNIETKDFEILDNKDCNFGYRNSIFKEELKGKVVITEVYFKLKKTPEIKVNYGGLNTFFYEGENISIKTIREAVVSIRSNKLPNHHMLGNSGSFFKNSIVDQNKINELINKFSDIKYFEAEGGFKIPTAWLIEKAGLKGYKRNNVGVYNNHSLILVNYGGAKAKDVLELAEYIENKIESKFGIKIYKEVNVI